MEPAIHLCRPAWDEETSFLAQAKDVRPDILWVCLGTARQEKWMDRMKTRVDVPVMAGVGAAIDFLSGGKRRAPRLLQRAGLEWLFRLATEPRRLWRRYLVGNILFARLAAAALLRRGTGTEPLPSPHPGTPLLFHLIRPRHENTS